jgi:hypothetical protein
MADVFARRSNKRHMLRGFAQLTLTKYPAQKRKLIPGIAYSAKVPPSVFIPLNTNDYYGYTKSLSKPETTEQKDIVKIGSIDQKSQIGFGVVPEIDDSDEDEDISYTSSEKVDPAVLNAFINPSFKTNVTQINPQKRKIETSSETVKTLTPTSVPKNKKSKIGQKLKFEK